MGESVKAVLSLVVVVAFVCGIFAWQAAWKFPSAYLMQALGISAAFLVSLGVLIWAQFRRDKLPDKLREIARRHFECDGLSFVVGAVAGPGRQCFIEVHFQNRYARPCVTTLLFRPAGGFVMGRRPKDLTPFEVKVECEGAAFGVARVPYAVPQLRQGEAV